MVKGSESQEVTLAITFDAAVSAMYADDVNVTKVAGACAVLLTTYLTRVKPTDRILLINETLEALLSGISENCDGDLLH